MSDRPSWNRDGPDIELARRIDEVCRRFEADWREGRRPRFDELLVDVPHEGRAALRTELEALERELRESDETVAGLEPGTSPAPEPQTAPFPFTNALGANHRPRTVANFSAARSGTLIGARAGYRAASQAAGIAPRSAHGRGARPGSIGRTANVRTQSHPLLRRLRDHSRDCPRRHGVVFQARQVSLNRIVALKMILSRAACQRQQTSDGSTRRPRRRRTSTIRGSCRSSKSANTRDSIISPWASSRGRASRNGWRKGRCRPERRPN